VRGGGCFASSRTAEEEKKGPAGNTTTGLPVRGAWREKVHNANVARACSVDVVVERSATEGRKLPL